jgi:hypothetical protein
VYFEFTGARPVRILKDFDGAASRASLNPRHGAWLEPNGRDLPDLRSGNGGQ